MEKLENLLYHFNDMKITIIGSSLLKGREFPVEIVERKGIGHPDSLCDGMAERISQDYSRWCLKQFGVFLHHNFDKIQLVAGSVELSFGDGQLVKPLRVQVAGRASFHGPHGEIVPVELIVIEAVKAHLRDTLTHLDPDHDCIIECFCGQGAIGLIRTAEKRLSNDTSFGAAHWPLSKTERTVYDLSEALNYKLLKDYPIGEDTKVMGIRHGGDLRFICAVPFLAKQIKNIENYLHLKSKLQNELLRLASEIYTEDPITVLVNTADDPTAKQVYLTLTGTSAEMGDDGAVGRGNRVTGVIAPFHLASLEATAGKNPFSHPGKIYNVLALLICQDLIAQVPDLIEAQACLVSQIGHTLKDPSAVTIIAKTPSGFVSEKQRERIHAIVNHRLENLDAVTPLLLEGKISVY